MSIFKYEVLNPVANKNKPHYSKGFFIVPNINKPYRYFVEAANYNTTTFNKDYYLLLSVDRFDENCRKCRVDDYGRLKVKPKGEFKDYIEDVTSANGNITFEYLSTEGDYDVWQIGE